MVGNDYYDGSESHNAANNKFLFKQKVDHLFDEYEVIKSVGHVRLSAVFHGRKEINTNNRFLFRNDVKLIDTNHELLSIKQRDFKAIVGIRDPRDQMLSMFNAWKAEDFNSFCHKKIYDWIWFYEKCLQYPNIKIFKFEDRKKDEFKFLKEIVKFMSVDFADDELRQAVLNSSFEKMKQLQDEMINKYPEYLKSFQGGIIKSGVVSQYLLEKNRHYKKAFDFIIKKTATLMKKYGYTEEQIYGDKVSNMLKINKLFTSDNSL